ncbi:transglycosylase SLT domain-containing protein [Flectobacillus longus]|uniref:transglycosylase SLT domain-containing protein n=1 Tax=Flectobacillus longus TaxID=2984207 RepID=UPI0024B70189|nr:transglycosylase SLT domain-containing protein [Flectobacillus longus]MDI9880903.1 transglycosylase SLT domain-containing protein [Flectobacillus longus]
MSLICLNKLGWNVDKVAFEKEVRDICSDPLIRIKNPNWLTLVFNAESSMKFPNVNRIGAVGYIQITKSTAKDLQTTVEHLKTLSPIEYLYYVRKYLRMRVKQYGAPDSAYELYALVHYPVAFKKAENYVLYRRGSDAYSGNSALDYNADGAVTVKEMNQFFDKRLPLLYDKELLFTPEDSSRIYLANIELKYILAGLFFGLAMLVGIVYYFKKNQITKYLKNHVLFRKKEKRLPI